jgi:hypothetical protein
MGSNPTLILGFKKQFKFGAIIIDSKIFDFSFSLKLYPISYPKKVLMLGDILYTPNFLSFSDYSIFPRQVE